VVQSNVVARLWRGQAEAGAKADAYFEHVTLAVFPSLANIPGHRGAYLLRRAIDGRVEFLALTLWDSLDAIRGFAGRDIDRAHIEPEGRAVLVEFDEFARNFEIVHQTKLDCAGCMD
jgi:heme-degrading monooxygenase HmoA